MKVETIEELNRVIQAAKAAGLAFLELDGLKIRFAKKENQAPMIFKFPAEKAEGSSGMVSFPDAKPEDLVKPLSVLDELTPEEVLYYATPHFDEIQADKELKKQLSEDSVS